METHYFDFRIIICADGTEIIDRRVKTAYKALTQKQLIEYAWLELELEILDKQERKAEPYYSRPPESFLFKELKEYRVEN